MRATSASFLDRPHCKLTIHAAIQVTPELRHELPNLGEKIFRIHSIKRTFVFSNRMAGLGRLRTMEC